MVTASPDIPAARARLGAAALLLLLLLSFLCAAPARALDLASLVAVKGEGEVAAEARNVGTFRGLSLSTAARVVVRQGEREAVEVRGEANVRPLIDTYVDNGSLVVEDSRRFTSDAAEVIVTVRRLSAIAAGKSVAVVVEGLHAPSLSLALGGSSTLSLRQARIGKLSVAQGGSSALQASGSADALACQLGGSATVQAAQLAARSVAVNGGGSAQATVWASEALSIALGGSAGVGYYGVARPTQATSGSASVRFLGAAPPTQP